MAKQYEGQYNFAVSAKDDFQHELNEYGYDYVPSEKPLICARDDNKQKFVMKDEFSYVHRDWNFPWKYSSLPIQL